ncbi:MAG: cytochrome c3 family protein [Verrucomicrobiales bacterium]|nr:cytochrome c3 family protein [Verrucomicrobiales bacterium]
MRIGTALALAAATAAIAVSLNSCATPQRTVVVPQEIPGATFVGDRVCYECHTNYARVFPASPHARLQIAQAPPPGEAGCEACHGPGSRHVAAPARGSGLILNPGRDPAACFRCHLETHAEFALPQHHPVLEGRMNCVQCHDPHGFDMLKPARGLALARVNETCGECHRDQAKPFVFEHEAMREGCTVCHVPHGSVNPKLLVERDNNLCLKCHAQIQGPLGGGSSIFIGKEDHTDKLRLGSCWSAGCHTAVHGSNFHPTQLY